MNDEYSQVIAVLMTNDVDFRAIGIKLAQTNPKLFLLCCGLDPIVSDTVKPEPKPWYSNRELILGSQVKLEPKPLQWIIDTISYLPNDPISAVKLVRHKTTLSLKDAKDVVDNVRVTLGIWSHEWEPNPLTTDEEKIIHEALVKYATTILRERFDACAGGSK